MGGRRRGRATRRRDGRHRAGGDLNAAATGLLRRLLAAAAFACAAASALAQPPAAPDEGRTASDRLRQLPASVQQVREVLRTASVGPFQLAGSCRFNGAWCCF